MRRSKSKRGERGSSDNELANPKRLNMADANEATEEATDEEATDEEAFEMEETKENDEEPSLLEIREMLVNIQITVSDIQMKNIQLTEEMAALRSIIESQKRDLDATKTTLVKVKRENKELKKELEAVRKKVTNREEEIEELYDLQDDLEQYTRKKSLEIHGIPENAYTSTEEAVLKVAEALDVPVAPNDIDISHNLYSEGEKPILVKFVSHKTKTQLYKKRTSLKHVKLSDIFPNASAATIVEGKKIFINENLTSFRRGLLNKANEKRRQGMLVSVWTWDGKIFVKTSPEGRPVRIYHYSDLDRL